MDPASIFLIAAQKENFLHLTGVSSHRRKGDFFDACLNGSVCKSDFNFEGKRRSARENRGNARRKLNSFPRLRHLFSSDLLIEQNYVKNSISCSLAASEGRITIGFTGKILLAPMTLLKGNHLHNPQAVSFVLRKKNGEEKFNELIYGDENCLPSSLRILGYNVSEDLIETIWNEEVHHSEF